MTFWSGLTIVLICLKLMALISVSWWIVFSPLIVLGLIQLVIVIGGLGLLVKYG